jgi:hypothetical protein
MAIIAFSRKYVFIKTRKTAGTSIQESLLPYLVERDIVTREWTDLRSDRRCVVQEFASLGDIRHYFPETQTGYFTFGFTRNPYAITLSRYFYQIKMKRIPGPPSPKDFNRWVQNIYFIGEPGFAGARYLRDRTRYLLFDASLAPLVDFIGKVENMKEDFASVVDRIGPPAIAMTHVNRSNVAGVSYRDWLDPASRKLVEENFDFELSYFGYRFEDRG